MGLHLNVSESQLGDVDEREHRNRIWWTAYIFDRMWAAKLGYPCAIRDEEIEVDFPSISRADDDMPGHGSCVHFIARIGLARISGRMISSIYCERTHTKPLSNRVQKAFQDLRQWLEELPISCQINQGAGNSTDPRTRSLHLLFNQVRVLCCILASHHLPSLE